MVTLAVSPTPVPIDSREVKNFASLLCSVTRGKWSGLAVLQLLLPETGIITVTSGCWELK